MKAAVWRMNPIADYWATRRKLWRKLLLPFTAPVVYGCLQWGAGVEFQADRLFDGWTGALLTVISIIMSFSIAIISILVSADNPSLRALKSTPSTECRPRCGHTLSLFQVLLSGIAYNVLVEVAFLILLLIQLAVQALLPKWMKEAAVTLDLFFLSHILCVLVESVLQMYLTFWADRSSSGSGE